MATTRTSPLPRRPRATTIPLTRTPSPVRARRATTTSRSKSFFTTETLSYRSRIVPARNGGDYFDLERVVPGGVDLRAGLPWVYHVPMKGGGGLQSIPLP